MIHNLSKQPDTKYSPISTTSNTPRRISNLTTYSPSTTPL